MIQIFIFGLHQRNQKNPTEMVKKRNFNSGMIRGFKKNFKKRKKR